MLPQSSLLPNTFFARGKIWGMSLVRASCSPAFKFLDDTSVEAYPKTAQAQGEGTAKQ